MRSPFVSTDGSPVKSAAGTGIGTVGEASSAAAPPPYGVLVEGVGLRRAYLQHG